MHDKNYSEWLVETFIPSRFNFRPPPVFGGYAVFTLSAGVWLVALLQPRRNLFIYRCVCWRWNSWSRRQVRQACRGLEQKDRVHLKLSGNQLLSLSRENHQVSVFVSTRGAVAQRRQQAAVDVSCLVPLVQAVSLKLGHPDVEELMALCLRRTNIFYTREYLFSWK